MDKETVSKVYEALIERATGAYYSYQSSRDQEQCLSEKSRVIGCGLAATQLSWTAERLAGQIDLIAFTFNVSQEKVYEAIKKKAKELSEEY